MARGGGFGYSRILLVAAIVAFVLAAFGADISDEIELLPLGLALFAASFVD